MATAWLADDNHTTAAAAAAADNGCDTLEDSYVMSLWFEQGCRPKNGETPSGGIRQFLLELSRAWRFVLRL